MFKSLMGLFLIAAVVITFIYGSYWVAKNASYHFFYKNMVRKEIRLMVNEGSLI